MTGKGSSARVWAFWRCLERRGGCGHRRDYQRDRPNLTAACGWIPLNQCPTSVTGAQRWPRGARVALYTAAVVGTVLLMAMCSIGLMMLAGCDEPAAKSVPLCSESGRMFIPVGLVVMVAVTIPWLLFLARVLGLRGEDATPEQTSAAELPKSWSANAVRLHLGQHLVSGEVESVSLNAGGYCATVQGLAGDQAAFVYQQVPSLGLRYVLVFWKGGDSPLQGVGALIHACFFLLGVLGTGLASAQKQGYPAWFMPTCGVLFAVSTTYLLLLFFAKRALRDLIKNGFPT
jgi:hypothetical protein